MSIHMASGGGTEHRPQHGIKDHRLEYLFLNGTSILLYSPGSVPREHQKRSGRNNLKYEFMKHFHPDISIMNTKQL